VVPRLHARLDQSGRHRQNITLHVRPRFDLPRAVTQMVDEWAISESRGLPEKHADRRAIGDRFGIEILGRRGRC